MKFLEANNPIALKPPATIGAFVFDETAVVACNTAIASGKPILLRGEPSFPRRELALALAVGLQRVFIESEANVTQGIDELLFTRDDAARQAEVNIAGALALSADEIRNRLRLGRFIQPGPIWWAFDPRSAKDVSYENDPSPSGKGEFELTTKEPNHVTFHSKNLPSSSEHHPLMQHLFSSFGRRRLRRTYNRSACLQGGGREDG